MTATGGDSGRSGVPVDRRGRRDPDHSRPLPVAKALASLWRRGQASEAQPRSTSRDSESPRRTTVMCALRRSDDVTHEYQSDSSSILPVSPVFQNASSGPGPPRTSGG